MRNLMSFFHFVLSKIYLYINEKPKYSHVFLKILQKLTVIINLILSYRKVLSFSLNFTENIIKKSII